MPGAPRSARPTSPTSPEGPLDPLPSFPGRPAIFDHLSSPALTDALIEKLLHSECLEDFLHQALPLLTSRILGDRDGVHASLLLLRPRKPALAVSSGDPAEALHETPGRFPDGPGRTALREGSPVRVGDARTDRRWPAHLTVAVDHGIHSLLALPLEFGEEGQGVLTFCSTRPREFPPDLVDRAAAMLGRAAGVLPLAVRLDRYRLLEQDLRAAMSTRTAIDLAVGILMAQDRSDQEGAFAVLKRASHHRNLPVREIAVEVVERFSQRTPNTHFDA